MRSCLFTRPPQSCAPTFHPLCLLYRSRAKRKMLRRMDFAFAAMAGRGQLYNGCGVPRRRLVNITEPAAHTLQCGLARGGAGYICKTDHAARVLLGAETRTMWRHLGEQLQLWLAVAVALAGGAALCRQTEPRDQNAVPKTG